jgi:hypothetical protein
MNSEATHKEEVRQGLLLSFLLGSRIVAPVGIARAFRAASVLGVRRIEFLQPIGHIEYLHGRR